MRKTAVTSVVDILAVCCLVHPGFTHSTFKFPSHLFIFFFVASAFVSVETISQLNDMDFFFNLPHHEHTFIFKFKI